MGMHSAGRQGSEGDEDGGGRLAAEQEEGRHQQGEQTADQDGERQRAPKLAELEVAADELPLEFAEPVAGFDDGDELD